MLGKILFTIGVIVLVVLIWRTRRPRDASAYREPRLVNPPVRRQWPIRGLALGVVALMLATSGRAATLMSRGWLPLRTKILLLM